MICEICGMNPATVHLTEIRGKRMSERHLCERCAEEGGLETFEGPESDDASGETLQ